MARLTDDETDRRRRLRGYSRYDDTHRNLILELSADGKDYREVEGFVEPELADTWQVARLILEGEPRCTRGLVWQASDPYISGNPSFR